MPFINTSRPFFKKKKSNPPLLRKKKSLKTINKRPLSFYTQSQQPLVGEVREKAETSPPQAAPSSQQQLASHTPNSPSSSNSDPFTVATLKVRFLSFSSFLFTACKKSEQKKRNQTFKYGGFCFGPCMMMIIKSNLAVN